MPKNATLPPGKTPATTAHASRHHGDVIHLYNVMSQTKTVIPGSGVAQDRRVGGGASRPFSGLELFLWAVPGIAGLTYHQCAICTCNKYWNNIIFIFFGHIFGLKGGKIGQFWCSYCCTAIIFKNLCSLVEAQFHCTHKNKLLRPCTINFHANLIGIPLNLSPILSVK